MKQKTLNEVYPEPLLADLGFLVLIGIKPCKTDQSLKGKELQRNKGKKDEKHVGKLTRANPKIKDYRL